jgi:hypothetical protein
MAKRVLIPCACGRERVESKSLRHAASCGNERCNEKVTKWKVAKKA